MGSPASFSVEIVSARLAANDHPASIIECHIIFRGECKSSEEIPCQTSSDIEINFTADLLMTELQSDEVEDDWHAIVYITSRPAVNGSGISGYRQLMARAFLDLRLAQIYQEDFLSLEIFHCFDLTDGLESGTAGVLFIKLSTEGYTTTDEKSAELSAKIQGTQNQINYEMHQNFQAMRILWAKARKNFPFVENRPMIKLIAEDECGQNRICCDFVRPIYPPRDSELANGPRFAARFVSLIPFNRLCSLSGGRRESWLPAQAMLLRRSGDIEDHANLLCSLLLGWGMNAFVCSGYIRSSFRSVHANNCEDLSSGESSSSIPHYWVVTLDSPNSTLFWEPLSGQQFEIPLVKHKVELNSSSRRRHPFLSLAVIYRNDTYLLNVQQQSLLQYSNNSSSTPSSSATSFDITDRKSWVELLPSSSAYAIRVATADAGVSVRRHTGHPATHTSLSSPHNKCYLDVLETKEVNKLELSVEKEIKGMLVSWREEEGLNTRFDEQLSIILQVSKYYHLSSMKTEFHRICIHYRDFNSMYPFSSILIFIQISSCCCIFSSFPPLILCIYM